MKTYGELLLCEEFDLHDFWEYCNNIEKEMIERCDWSDGEERKLPLSNRMICYAFAAMSYKDHAKRIDRVNTIEEMREEFNNKNKGIYFDEHLKPGFSLFDLMWKSYEERAKNILASAGIDTVDKLISSTDEDLIHIRGIGKKMLDTIHYCQKSAKAHIDFFKTHEDFYTKEAK